MGSIEFRAFAVELSRAPGRDISLGGNLAVPLQVRPSYK